MHYSRTTNLISVFRMLVVDKEVYGGHQRKQSNDDRHDDEYPTEALHTSAWACTQAVVKNSAYQSVTMVILQPKSTSCSVKEGREC